jgi:hypothetical protein
MSNTFVANLIPRILPKTLEVLREDAPIIGWARKDYEGITAGSLGDTVTVQKSVPLAIGDVSPAMIAPSPTDCAPGYVSYQISNWKKASFGLTQKEYSEIIAGNFVPFQVEEAIRTVVNAVASSMSAEYYRVSNVAGKTGTCPFASNSIQYMSDAETALTKALCPKGNRRAWISLKDANTLRTNTGYGQYINIGQEPEGSNIVRDGNMKAFFGFKSVQEDFWTPVHTVGTLGGGTVAVTGPSTAAGATTVNVTVTGGSGLALKKGDIIKIATETYPARDTYSLMADVSIAAAGTGDLLLNRGLSTAKTTDAVTIAYSDAISGGTTAFGTSIQNLVGDPSGIALTMRVPSSSLMDSRTMYDSMPMVDPVTGAVLLLTYLGGYHQAAWEVSALYGLALVDERKFCRLVSTAAF